MRVWDLDSVEQLRVLESSHRRRGGGVDPAGAQVVSGSADGTLRVWDIDLPSHAGMRAIGFADRSDHVILASKVIRIHAAATPWSAMSGIMCTQLSARCGNETDDGPSTDSPGDSIELLEFSAAEEMEMAGRDAQR